MAFNYETGKVEGRGTFARRVWPTCGREGLLQFDTGFAKENARLVHGYGSCPNEEDFAAGRDKHESLVPNGAGQTE